MNWLSDILHHKPTQEQFAQLVITHLSKMDGIAKARYDRQEFAVVALDDKGTVVRTIYLTNSYADYCKAPASQREQVLATYIYQTFAMPANIEEARSQLLPRLQPRAFYESTKLSRQISGQNDNAADIPYKIFGEHFGISLVVDSPTQIMYINESTLKEWATTFDDCWTLAINNLSKLTPVALQELAKGSYVCQYLDNHGASRILLDERITECELHGRPIAFTPNRDSLLLTGEDDEEGLQKFVQMVSESANDPRAMPAFPLVYEKGLWQPWSPSQEHPCYQMITNLIETAYSAIYEAQKPLIERQLKALKQDIFVASYMLYSDKDSTDHQSLATWSKGIPTLLPVTQKIVFLSNKLGIPYPALVAPFAAATEALPELMELLDYYPPRYRVMKFPSDDQLERLKKSATTLV